MSIMMGQESADDKLRANMIKQFKWLKLLTEDNRLNTTAFDKYTENLHPTYRDIIRSYLQKFIQGEYPDLYLLKLAKALPKQSKLPAEDVAIKAAFKQNAIECQQVDQYLNVRSNSSFFSSKSKESHPNARQLNPNLEKIEMTAVGLTVSLGVLGAMALCMGGGFVAGTLMTAAIMAVFAFAAYELYQLYQEQKPQPFDSKPDFKKA